jgi:hypothetical protein
MRKVVVIAVMMVISLSACTATTVEGLRQNAGYTRTFDLPQNYQMTYRDIFNQMRACFASSFWALDIDGQLYSDLKEGVVSFGTRGQLQIAATVRAEGEGSRVEVIVYYRNWRATADQVEDWAKGSTGTGASCF